MGELPDQQRTAARSALLSCLHEKSDEDWTSFLVDEISANLVDITTPVGLYNQIGDHLSSIAPEANLMGMCSQIFTALRKAGVLPHPVDEVEVLAAPEEEVESSDEDSNEICKQEGCCEICSRCMPLTKHHLIPREVHAWYKKREKTHKELHTGIMICRDCHSAVHRFISNKDLGSEWNTLEKLLQHEKVKNWIPYISKQRCTSKADKRTWVQRVPQIPDSDED